MDLSPRNRPLLDSSSLDSGSLTSLDSSVFCSEGEGEPLALGDCFTVNVGGSRFVLSQQALSCFPHTRLGKLAVVVASYRRLGALAAAPSPLELCDDANPVDNEYFFDRSSQAFRYVLHYYRTGRLQVKELSETLDFKKDTDDQESQHESEQDFSKGPCPTVRQKLWDILEKPGSSTAARIFGVISIIFVAVSIVNMALMSAELSWLNLQLLEILEYVCISWFTGEFVLRFLCVKDRCHFLRKVPNIIDLLAILPFYITLLVESLSGSHTTQELENVGRLVQVLRLLRALRMLKLGRHSTGLRSLGMTITQCYEEVGLLLLFLSVGISIFSTIEYFAEQSILYFSVFRGIQSKLCCQWTIVFQPSKKYL